MNRSREYIINTLFSDFNEKIDDDVIEASLIKLGIISSVSKTWLKEHFIDKQLSAKECAEIAGCSVGHIQKCVQTYKLTKKKFGITTGNNGAHRRMLWNRNIQNAQPHRKEVVVFHVGADYPIFECPSIAYAAKKLNISREHIRDCLSPTKPRKTAGGFSFMHLKAWEEVKAFKKARQDALKPRITSSTPYEQMIAIAKEDIKRSYK
ncbi:MAG: hypothetical protein PHO62_07680 [Sulfurimonas sp.]|uniref:hypothetical protein n=1 Tax=Sulfurimonas sp. TaxID=2022749 RepID=UPI002610EF2A|nr:hypothetical protein [Sulfurimonas sp.]MDD5373286.1 hypothetical protein [Sulfurimonas sp.]